MENASISTNSNTGSKKKYIIFAGILALVLFFIGTIAIIVANNANKKTAGANGEVLDSIDEKDIASNEIKYTKTKDYSKTLNIYSSIDNGITLGDLKKVVSGAGNSDSAIIMGEESSRIEVENGEYITFGLEYDEDSNVQYIIDLTYHNNNYDLEETIRQIEGSKYQHFTNVFTNDFSTKEEAIDDFLMRH